ncbi:hypothetical protein HDE_04266 [Halotydeus destructor]|nr:hypothetical protein HDE_04266 [Halotydeus destructor]
MDLTLSNLKALKTRVKMAHFVLSAAALNFPLAIGIVFGIGLYSSIAHEASTLYMANYVFWLIAWVYLTYIMTYNGVVCFMCWYLGTQLIKFRLRQVNQRLKTIRDDESDIDILETVLMEQDQIIRKLRRYNIPFKAYLFLLIFICSPLLGSVIFLTIYVEFKLMLVKLGLYMITGLTVVILWFTSFKTSDAHVEAKKSAPILYSVLAKRRPKLSRTLMVRMAAAIEAVASKRVPVAFYCGNLYPWTPMSCYENLMSSKNKEDLNKRVHSTRNRVQQGNASLLPTTSLADRPEEAIQKLLEKQFANNQAAAANRNQEGAGSSEGPNSEASGSRSLGRGGQVSTELTTTTEEEVVPTSQVEEDNSLEDSNSNSEVEVPELGNKMDSQSQNMLMVMNQCLNDMFDGRKQNSAAASEWLVRSVRGMAKRSKEDATLTEAEREFQRDLILGRMAGPALRWANQLFETSATAGWNTFKSEFKSKYVDTMSKNEAFRKLGSLRRRNDQSIHEYIEYAQRLFDTVGKDLPNLMKCTAMYNGLDEYLRDKLYDAQEEPVDNFISKLIGAEKVREVVQRNKEPKERDHGQNLKPMKFDKTWPSSSQPKLTSGKLSDDARSRLLEEGKCFRCNEKGHLQRDCPKPAPGHHGNNPAKVKEEEKPKAKNAAIDTRDKDLSPSPIFRVNALDLERFQRSPSATATRPFATFKVDGHAVTFLVDSGADKSCITEALADKIGTMNFQSRWSLSSATGDDLGVTGDALVLLDLGKFKKVALVTVCRKLPNCIIGVDLIREAEMDIDFKGGEIKVQKEGFFIESNLIDTVLEKKRQWTLTKD